LSGLVNWEIRLNGKVDHLTKEENFWKIQTETGDIFYSRYVIGADGPNSFVAKKVFGKKHILIPAINYSTDFENQVPDNALQMYFGNQIAPFGYGWFFPTSKNCANVGLLLKDKTGNIKKYYSDFLEAVIRPLYGNFKLKENKSGALPINGFSMPVMKENVFLAGDAGAFTDPIFEGGINMALLTGRLAAESINKDNPQYFHDKIAGLPFTGKDLVLAQKIFYGLDDGTLNELGDVLNQNGTSFLNTREGMEAFLSKPSLVKHKEDIFQFAKIWNSAKSYIW
jgi:flavin-dependent dehydrogenase